METQFDTMNEGKMKDKNRIIKRTVQVKHTHTINKFKSQYISFLILLEQIREIFPLKQFL